MQWFHRTLGIGILLVALAYGWAARRDSIEPLLKKIAFGVVGVVCLQFLLGVLTLIWMVPVTIATLHQVVGALTLISLTVNQYMRKSLIA